MIEFGDRSTNADTAELPDVGAALAKLGGVYRSMPESKLLGRVPDGRWRAVAGHALADEVAKAAQGIVERLGAAAPEWRDVPFIGPFVVGDQLTVMAYELTAALSEVERADEQVWSGGDEGARTAGASDESGRPAGPAAPQQARRAAIGEVLAELMNHVKTLSLAC